LLLVEGAAGDELLDLIVGHLVVILIAVLLNPSDQLLVASAEKSTSSCVPEARQSSDLMSRVLS